MTLKTTAWECWSRACDFQRLGGSRKEQSYSNGASEADSFSTTGPGQLRAVKDGEELLSYESTSLALNSTNPVTPSAATTPSTQSQAPPDWVCASKARVGIVGCSRDSPSDHNSRRSRAALREGQTTRDDPQWLPAVLGCLCLSQGHLRAGGEQRQFVNTQRVS